eukprot:RCo003913
MCGGPNNDSQSLYRAAAPRRVRPPTIRESKARVDLRRSSVRLKEVFGFPVRCTFLCVFRGSLSLSLISPIPESVLPLEGEAVCVVVVLAVLSLWQPYASLTLPRRGSFSPCFARQSPPENGVPMGSVLFLSLQPVVSMAVPSPILFC